MTTRDDLADRFSAECLAALARPGGYASGEGRDALSGAPTHLDHPAVPLGVADHVLWAHADALVAHGRQAEGWEATLADLAQDLAVRCAQLEARLAAGA